MSSWREKLFVFMSRNAQSATRLFGLPPNRLVKLDAQIEFQHERTPAGDGRGTSMDPLTFMGGPIEVFYRLLAAVIVGCVLGVNRDLRDKPAGLRTHALVALGAALVTVTAEELAFTNGQMDGSVVSRAIQGIMAGIGFVGGGVILRDVQRNDVHGLTTAASIWLAACLGISCGAGHWAVALIALTFTLAVLIVGGPVERTIYRWMHGRTSPRGDREN